MRTTEAKTLFLGPGHHYNVYRGCTHGCIYCDSRSLCYEIDPPFEDVIVKTNAPALAERELAHRRSGIVCRSGSMSDPYLPLEATLGLSRTILEIIQRHGHGAAFLTKSVLALRDLDLMTCLARTTCGVAAFTITTIDAAVARRIEPFASLPSARLDALARFAEAGVTTGVWMTPLLPWITATEANVRAIVSACAAVGVKYMVGGSGTTMRDGSREHFYRRLDELYPGLRRRYEERYGSAYICEAPDGPRLRRAFEESCDAAGIAWRDADVRPYFQFRAPSVQLSLFDGDHDPRNV